jgi:hypothetical protein
MSVAKLRKFRRQCEREAGKSANEIELPLLHVLVDVCQALGLSKTKRRQVLGRKGVQQLGDYREWHVHLKE